MFAELKAMLGLDAGQFNAQMKQAGNNVDKFGGGLSKIKGLLVGAFSVGAIISFGRRLLRAADDLATTAKSFNLTMESMIAFKTVMAESGIQTDRFLKIFSKLKYAQGEVISQTGEYKDAVKDLNLSEEEFVGLPVDKLLERLGGLYLAAGEGSKEYAAIMKILGERVGVDLIEVFKRLDKEGLSAIEKRTKSAAEGMKSLAAASDTLEHTGDTIQRWAATGISAIGKFAEALGKASMAESDWVKEESVGGKGLRARRYRLTGRKPLQEEEKASSDILALRAQKEKELNEARKKTEKEVAAVQDAVIKETWNIIDKKEALYEKEREIREETAKEEKELLAGKGIETPAMGRVDALQAIGGLVGGIAGGDQAARRAERQEKIQEELKKLSMEANKKLDGIQQGIADLDVE